MYDYNVAGTNGGREKNKEKGRGGIMENNKLQKKFSLKLCMQMTEEILSYLSLYWICELVSLPMLRKFYTKGIVQKESIWEHLLPCISSTSRILNGITEDELELHMNNVRIRRGNKNIKAEQSPGWNKGRNCFPQAKDIQASECCLDPELSNSRIRECK